MINSEKLSLNRPTWWKFVDDKSIRVEALVITRESVRLVNHWLSSTVNPTICVFAMPNGVSWSITENGHQTVVTHGQVILRLNQAASESDHFPDGNEWTHLSASEFDALDIKKMKNVPSEPVSKVVLDYRRKTVEAIKASMQLDLAVMEAAANDPFYVESYDGSGRAHFELMSKVMREDALQASHQKHEKRAASRSHG